MKSRVLLAAAALIGSLLAMVDPSTAGQPVFRWKVKVDALIPGGNDPTLPPLELTIISPEGTKVGDSISLTPTPSTAGPFHWELVSGPPWLIFGPGGTLSGTPPGPGNYPFEIKVTEQGGSGRSAQGAGTIQVTQPEIEVSVVSKPEKPTIGNPLNVTTSVRRTDKPEISFPPSGYDFSLISGAPSWLSVNADGTVTGETDTPGTSKFVVRAENKSDPVHYGLSEEITLEIGLPDGNLMGWGRTLNGAIGNGSSSPDVGTPTPAIVPGDATGWTSLAGGMNSSCGIKSGELWCWGSGDLGQVPQGFTQTQNLQPVKIAGFTDWQIVAGTNNTYCGIRSGGLLYCWGHNSSGGAGIGTNVNSIVTPTKVDGTGWTHVSLGPSQGACGIREELVYCWGGSKTEDWSPRLKGGEFNTPGWTITTGSRCGLKNNRVYCWGSNANGDLGPKYASSFTSDVPVLVFDTSDWTQITGHQGFCGIRNGGEMYCWGYNTIYVDGTNVNITGASSPKKIGTFTNWKSISKGTSNICGIRKDGSLYCWGVNTYKGVGDGTTTTRLVPTPVGTGSQWLNVTAGSSHVLAIKSP